MATLQDSIIDVFETSDYLTWFKELPDRDEWPGTKWYSYGVFPLEPLGELMLYSLDDPSVYKGTLFDNFGDASVSFEVDPSTTADDDPLNKAARTITSLHTFLLPVHDHVIEVIE